MMNGGSQLSMSSHPSQPSGKHPRSRGHPTAEVRIIEQPASNAIRFRYECEGRSAGSIPGARSTPKNKTFPEIQVVGYQGRAVVVVSCVTKDEPYRVHPHNLVGREGCKKGVCTLEIPPETMRVQFTNLGIQCVKKRDIESSLRQREQTRIDPFRQGYNHLYQPASIDSNAVRLCFQVFLKDEKDGVFSFLPPVVSDVIYDKKATSDLKITRLAPRASDESETLILLCEKVAKEDIEIHFYEERDGERVWQAKADFRPKQVHYQHAIWFSPPRYRKDVSEPVDLFIQLYRPSDCAISEPTPFQLLPMKPDSQLHMQQVLSTDQMTPVKTEPRDAAYTPYVGTSPYAGTSSYGGTSPYGATSPYGGTSPYAATSPYGGIMHSVSPNYAPSPALTPSPENIHYQYRQQPVNIGNYNIMPAIKTDQTWNVTTSAPQNRQQTWSFPSTSENVATKPSQVHILDIDNHQINSGDLQKAIQGMDMSLGSLPEIGSLSLIDI